MFPFDKPHNDLVFENKNKMYGAYVIRREYDYALKISILIATGFLGLIVTAGIIASNRNTTIPKVLTELGGTIITIDPPPIEKPDELIKPKTEKHEVTPTRPPAGELTASDEKKDNNEQKLETSPVNPNLPIGDSVTTNPGEKGSEFGTVENKTVEDNKIILIAPEMPDIEGGVLSYVSSHIKYPDEAKETHAEGTVHISFVVEKDGSVSNINVLNQKKVGYGCEEEAIRVIKSAKWKPGRNNGQAVRVQLTLPVRYKLQ